MMKGQDEDADLLSRVLFPRGVDETDDEEEDNFWQCYGCRKYKMMTETQIICKYGFAYCSGCARPVDKYFDNTVLPQLLKVHTSSVERFKQFNFVLDKAKRGTKTRKITVESQIYNNGTTGVNRVEYQFYDGKWNIGAGGSWYSNLYGDYHYSGGRATPNKINISRFVLSNRTRCGIEILGACPQVDKSGSWVYSRRDGFMSVANFKEACKNNGIKPKASWKKLDYAIALMKL